MPHSPSQTTWTTSSQCQSSPSSDPIMSYAKSSSSIHTINFEGVYNELQTYKQTHGHLSIPPNHASYTRIIDMLAYNDVDSAIKKRWLQKLALVRSLDLNYNDGASSSNNISEDVHDLDKWIQIQLDHYALHKEGLPHPLCGEQIEMLEGIGLQSLMRLRDVVAERNRERNCVARVAAADETAANNKMDTDDNEAAAVEATADVEETPLIVREHSDHSANALENNTTADMSVEFEATHEEKESENNLAKPDTDTILVKDTDQSTSNYIKGKCDICRKKDGHQGHNLQQCKSCNIKIHELCYGLVATEGKNPNFQCHACQAVNTQVEVNVPSRIGPISKKNTRKVMMQKDRPTECILCSFDDGSMHAMHPIMDTEGTEARQLVLPATKDKEERLAWAHTLCALFICKNRHTAGCVYGLKEDNLPDMEESDDDDDDEEAMDEEEEEDMDDGYEKGETVQDVDRDERVDKETSVEVEVGDDSEENLSGVRSFTIASDRVPGYEVWSNQIRDNRTKIKCYVCGQDDKKSLRIPVQCIVNEVWDRKHSRSPEKQFEFSEFKEWRRNCPEYNPNDVCTVGMHVGCARWGAVLENVAGKPAHQVYFYPGQQTGYDGEDAKFTEVVANCYCPAHARELIRGNPKNAGKLEQAATASKKRKAPPPQKQQSSPKKARRNRQFEAKKKKAEMQKAHKKMKAQQKLQKKTAKKEAKKAAKSQHNPFKRDPGAAAVDVKQEEKHDDDLIALGRSGRTMTKKIFIRESIAANSQSNEDGNEAQLKVKSENDSSTGAVAAAAAASKPQGPAKRSLKNLLTKVSQLDVTLQPPAAAAANQIHFARDPNYINSSHASTSLAANKPATRPVLFAQNQHIPYSSHAPSAMHGIKFNQPHTTDRTSSSRSLPIKPVSILKKKGSGPINYDACVQANDNPAKPIIKQECVAES
ncbi:hypothetical protein ACHAWO_012450 [Cyclotella atomus]|uniref:PHD-type domain-containing protein n=1 Tax=Cyclotella atomus TaxID=382360 RepID=A0ABD3PC23_9STRA